MVRRIVEYFVIKPKPLGALDSGFRRQIRNNLFLEMWIYLSNIMQCSNELKTFREEPFRFEIWIYCLKSGSYKSSTKAMLIYSHSRYSETVSIKAVRLCKTVVRVDCPLCLSFLQTITDMSHTNPNQFALLPNATYKHITAYMLSSPFVQQHSSQGVLLLDLLLHIVRVARTNPFLLFSHTR